MQLTVAASCASCASCAFSWLVWFLEISLTLFVATVTIQLDCVACALARSTAVFATFLRRTRARCVFAFLFVGHVYLRLNSEYFGSSGLRSLTQTREGSARRAVTKLFRLTNKDANLPARSTVNDGNFYGS